MKLLKVLLIPFLIMLPINSLAEQPFHSNHYHSESHLSLEFYFTVVVGCRAMDMMFYEGKSAAESHRQAIESLTEVSDNEMVSAWREVKSVYSQAQLNSIKRNHYHVQFLLFCLSDILGVPKE